MILFVALILALVLMQCCFKESVLKVLFPGTLVLGSLVHFFVVVRSPPLFIYCNSPISCNIFHCSFQWLTYYMREQGKKGTLLLFVCSVLILPIVSTMQFTIIVSSILSR